MAVQTEFFQYVFDACSLINIERYRKMNELRKRKGSIIIPEKVAYEVAYDPRIHSNAPLRKFILKYPQLITQFQDNEEKEYLQIRSQIGIDDGEASAITIALKRNLPLVIDDKKGREKAKNHNLKTLSWKDFLVMII